MPRTSKLSGAGFRLRKKSRHSTGVSVRASSKAPASAKAYVCAMGPKSWPSDPDIVNSGMNAQIEHREGEQERQRDVDGHDQGGTHVAEKHQQDQRHQHHAKNQIVTNGVGGEMDQFLAVVVGLDLNAGQQPAGLFQLFDL